MSDAEKIAEKAPAADRAGGAASPYAPDDVEDGPSPNLFSRVFGFLGLNGGEEGGGAQGGAAIADETRPPRARRDMIERVIAFYEKRVSDVMAPRADIIAVEATTGLNELVKAFAAGGHSRMPIFRGDLDDPVGMVHIKDVVEMIARPEEARAVEGPILKKLKRDVLYVPPSMRVTDVLLKMQASRIHMALVIDEYGGTDGLVTIEDLVEQIVGDINDEHDEEEALTLAPRAGGGWDVDARMELAEFARQTGVALAAEDDEADTLGGFVFSIAGRVPQRGEVLAHASGYDFEVTEADARKIRKIRIRPHRAAEAPRAEKPV
jgi:CBS domain containing-hemolysin-like protein